MFTTAGLAFSTKSAKSGKALALEELPEGDEGDWRLSCAKTNVLDNKTTKVVKAKPKTRFINEKID